MNVAYFTNNYRPFIGGVPVAIDKLAAGLRARGHRVLVFAPDYGADSGQTDETDVFRAPAMHNFNDTQFALPITLGPDGYALFNELHADVVHVHHPFLLGSTGLHLAREHGIPVVFTYHTQYEKYAHYLPWDTGMVQALAVTLSSRFTNQCDAVIAPSTDIRDMLMKRGVEVPVEVIPTGVDLAGSASGDPGSLRRTLGLSEEDRLLLFVSRLASEKNCGFLLDAFARAAADDPRLQLALVGSGDDCERLKQTAADAGIAPRVHFTGTLTGQPLLDAFRGADLFVFASQTETQGMVVLEAMAAGLPVVAVDASGVRDIVRDGVNGFLTPPGDVEAFVRALAKLSEDDALRDSMGKEALATAEGLSIEKTAMRVENVYRAVIRAPHHERHSRFLILRELGRYGLDKFNESLETFSQ